MTGLPSFDPNVLFGAMPQNSMDTLLRNFQKQAETQINQQQQALATPYEAEISNYRREMLEWTPVRESIDTAQNRVRSALTKLTVLSKTVDKMLHKVSSIDPNTDWAKVAREFDTLRTTLSSSAHSGGGENLLGTVRRGDTYAANSVTYQYGIHGEEATITGGYAGPDYDIRLADGTFFRPSGAQVMQRYEAYPEGKVGYAESVAGTNIGLDAPFNEGSLTFTVGKNTATPTQYSNGTVQRHGLGVLQSWLYEGLNTTDGRQRALDDLKDARDKLKRFATTMEMHKATLAAYDSRASEHVVQAEAKIREVQANAQDELQRYAVSAQQQAQANATALISSAANNPAVQLLQTNSRIGQLFNLTI